MSNVKITGDRFFEYMKKIPEVNSIDVITGNTNYLVKATVNNTKEMTLLLRKLMEIASIESFISLKHYNFD